VCLKGVNNKRLAFVGSVSTNNMDGSDDEFFGNGEEDETFDHGLRSAEFQAMEQRMRTLGFEEGVAQGTQKGIQRGFDAGYAKSKIAAHPFHFYVP
jgi:flagellar biosynthesis/type III secretory pathway protein FliH